jgi:hypothetical protein
MLNSLEARIFHEVLLVHLARQHDELGRCIECTCDFKIEVEFMSYREHLAVVLAAWMKANVC